MSSNAVHHLSLTRFQEELWLAHQALPEKHPGLASCGRFDLDGSPDPALVLRALTLLVKHFPILTATLGYVDESTPILKTGVYPEPDLRVVDLRGGDDPEAQAQQYLDGFREESFTPIGGRLCHFALLRLGDTRSCFLIRVFHLVGDGVAVVGQFSLMAEIYTALQAQQTLDLGPACLWDDDVEADRRYRISARATKDTEFWTEYLKRLPSERIFTPRCGYPDRVETTGQCNHVLSLAATACLHTLAAEYGGFTSLFLALHSIVLSRLYDADKLVIQVPFLFGERKDKRKIQGNRVIVSPSIIELDATDSFRAIIGKVQKNSSVLLRHAKTPCQDGLRQLDDWRSFEHLWDTNINYIPASPDGGTGDFRVCAYTPIPSRHEPMLLGVYFMENLPDQGVQLSIIYSHNHFTCADIQNYIARLEQLLFAVQQNPDAPVAGIDLLLESERQSLAIWQQGEAREFSRGTIPALFDGVAAQSPERIAIKATDGNACSYRQLKERSDSIAAWLAARNVQPGEVVAVMARRNPDLPETILGIMKAGAVYLPIDPDYPEERIRHMLDDSGARQVIALSGEARADFGLSLVTCPIPASLPEAIPPDAVSPDAPAYLIYTSGSTGRPKGVLVPHCGFVNMSQSMIALFGIRAEDRVLQFASPSFDASLAEIFMPLLAGACLYPVPRALLDEPWSLKEYMSGQRITAVTLPPSYLSVFRRETFPTLRVLVTAGEAPIAEDARHYAAELAYFNAYGPTEASVCATLTRVSADADAPYISIGKPLPNTRTYILDNRGRQVAPGIPGELCLGGIGLALGYLNRPDLDREKFVTLSFAPGERIYRTGDRAVWTELGDIVLLGRIDDQVKIRGHRIEPGEITELLEQHPAVAQACVLAVPGSGSGYELCAFIVPADAATIDIAAVQTWLRTRLPDFMVPARYQLLAAMPLAPTGKIDKRVLAGRLQASVSADRVPALGGSALEEAVRTHYEHALGHDIASLDDDFFALGGDSLKAIQLVRQLSQTFACKLSVRDFWADTRIAAVAKAIALGCDETCRETAVIETLPLSQGQLQLWNQECITGPSPRYNMPFAIEIEAGAQEVERFVDALSQAIESQPSCRCRVEGEIDAPIMKLLDASGLRIERIDLGDAPDRWQKAQQILDERANRPFDLTQAPLLRATLLQLEPARWQLLLVMHHIIGDAESLHILLQTAMQRLNGETLAPASPAALQRFVETERAYLETPAHRADLAFWQTQLSPLPRRLNLAEGHPRPAVKKGSGNLIYHALPPATQTGLQHLAEQAGTSVLGCFIGVLMRFLRVRTQGQDIAIAVPMGLRDEAELFSNVGYFVNTVLVRVAEPADTDLLASIRKTGLCLRQAVQHGRVPFGMLPAVLGERRDPSRAPLVDLVATQIDESAMLPTSSGGLKFKLIDINLRAAKFDATFFLITRSSSAGEVMLEHDTDIIPTEVAEKLLAELVDFIAHSVAETTQAKVACAQNDDAAVLAQVWQEILGGNPPQPESSFFLCGGDSIKAIQMIGLLRRKGIVSLSPAQLFAFPTFGELRAKLAEADRQVSVSRYAAPPAEAAIALLPIQRNLFRNHPEHWRAFHMALPIRLGPQVDTGRLQQALRELPARHEALRLAFTGNAMRLRQNPPALIQDEFTTPADMPTGEVFAQAAQQLFSRFDPENGSLLGAILIQHGAERLLLLAGHHLVLDAVSLDILRRELAWFCRHGEWPSRDSGPGVATWAAQLGSRSGDFPDAAEIRRWQTCCATPTAPLRTFNPAGSDRIAQRVALRRSIAGADQYLLTHPRSDLLAALAQALYAVGQTDAIFVLLEGHGREAIVPGLDISQAVGWFTSTFPLALTPSADLASNVSRLENWFGQLAHNGIGYGLAALRQPESLAYRPQIALNYLGRLLSADENDGFEPLPQWSSPDALPGLFHPDYRSEAPLDLLAYFSASDELCLIAHFSPQCLDQEWIGALLDAWQAALKRLAPANEDWAQLAAASQCAVDQVEAVGVPDPAQESMLFQHLLDAEQAPGLTYVQQINFRLDGEVDEAILADAWSWVINRHESLRSLFPLATDGEFRRLALKKARTTLERYDLSALPSALQASRREALLQARLHAPFDLARGPLLQMQLLRLAPDCLEMSWCFHHLLMDGWCVGILLRELFSSYVALHAGVAPNLPPAPTLQGYRQWRQRYDEAAARAWWTALLQGFDRATTLSPKNAPADPAETLQERELYLDETTARHLQNTAAQMSATLPNLLQALWGILLSTNGNAGRDTVYGLVSSGRPAEVAGIDSIVGLFIQTMPVRIRWNENDTLAALVGRVRDQAIERAPHEFLSLAEIQRVSAVTGPLFDHILVFENYPLDGIVQETAPKIGAVSGFEQHPYALGLSIIPGERLLFRFSFKPSVFTGPHIQRLQTQWQSLLDAVVSGSASGCLALERLLQPQAAIPDTFNQTARPYPRERSVCGVLCEIAAARPNAKAFIGPDGNHWSYRELDRVSDKIAAGLGALVAGEPVAMAMPRGPEAVAAMLGILKAGACYLPLDEKNPSARIGNMLRIASCRRLIHWRDGLARIDLQDWALLACHDYAALAGGVDASAPLAEPDAGQAAYVMFTSGSTGEPKGVVVPHRAILRLVCNSDFWDIAPEERVLQAGPLGFDASTLEIWGALLNGATVCFIRDDDLLSPKGLRRKIATDRITQMWLTSSLCNLFADEDPGVFASLRRLLTGGEALSPAHIRKIAAACPELEIFNGYGPTENTTFTTVHRITAADLDGPAIPIGRPVANTRVHIVNEHGALAAIGEWGEICAAGDGLALGYIGRDDLTRKAFVDLPAPVGERVYRSGDIGRWRDDGVIEFLGRRDGQVKIRGFRIELSEIEAAIGHLPDVRQVAVVAPGSGESRSLVAFVQADKPDADALKQTLKSILPAYMVPDRIECLAALPITGNGKLDRLALNRIALERRAQTPNDRSPINADKSHSAFARPEPADAGPASTNPPASPDWNHSGNDLEQRVATIFGEVLGISVTSPEADFFELGGQSLKAMRLRSRINHQLEVELSLHDVMSHPRVDALTRRIRATRHVAKSGPQPIGEKTDYLFASGQERLWFLQHLQPDSTAYHIPFATRLPGDVDCDALQQALTLLEARHDALRLRMPANIGEDELRQQIAEAGALVLDYRDFSAEADPRESVAAAIAEALSHPFRFGFDEPLLRASLLRESADVCVLLLDIHHIIFDGWSSEIFLRELKQAYRCALRQTRPDWPALPLRYVDYACWQREFLAGPDSAAARARWSARMTPLPEPLKLPTDKPRPALPSQQGEVLRFMLDASQTQGIKACARHSGHTLFPVLVALVKTFLYRHTGQTDLVVGVPVAGRDHENLQGLIGFFVNTVPLRARLQVDAGFDQLVQDIGASLREALDDQCYPLEMLVSDLNVPREASRNPLFDVLVSLDDPNWLASDESDVLPMRPYPLPHRQSKMDLSFYFHQEADRLVVDIEFATDLFERACIERMAQRLLVLTDNVLTAPAQPLRDVALMSAAERTLVLSGFNATEVDWKLDAGIDDCFRQALAAHPDAIALRASDGSILSYAELDRRVTTLAAQLQAEGVVPGAFVGVCYERSFDLMLAIFAVLRAGAVYVPFVPGLPAARIAAMAEDLCDCVILAADEQADKFRALGLRVLAPASVSGAFMPPTLASDAAAYVIFTSGSTGRPKGVLVEQRGVLNRLFWMQSRFPLDEHDVILQKTPVSFDVSVWELFWWSWTGASLALLAPDEEKDPAAIVTAIERHGVTVMHFVPSMLRAFLDHLERHPEAIAPLHSLRWVFASGEALTTELVARFNRLLHAAYGTELHNLYGPTEATVDVTWQPCSPALEGTSVPIGRPIANTRIYILDGAGQPAPVGVAGELFISGIQVARGYVGRPDLTAERFLPDPFNPPMRMYRSGDLARWHASGEIEYLGRCDDQVKIRGFRIELGEVEAALERCSGVAQAVVRVGEIGGMSALEAFLVPTEQDRFTLATLRRELAESLPDYMCPAAFYLVDRIPLNSSGKADRKTLQGQRLSLREAGANTLPEFTPTERALLNIWSQFFPEAGAIDAEQNFFDLGGNSLLLIRLHEQLEARWPGCFSLAELFVAVSIRQQAAHIDSAADGPIRALPAAPFARPVQDQAIAVIGMALRLGDYEDADSLWADLLAGCDRTGPMPEGRKAELMQMLAAIGIDAEDARLRQAAYLQDISGFDCKRFGMAPSDARLLDPEQRLFLETASRALDDAGYGGRALYGKDVGIFVGASPSQTFKEAVSRSFPDQIEQAFILNVPSSVATRLGYLKNWSGPAELVDTACSSSLKAVRDACQSLARGECSMALAGGARVVLTPMQGDKSFAIETTTGQTRTFDASADGVGAGEGAVAFLLKPLAQAQVDGDAIHAVILGGAINQDGRSASIAAPSPVAQAQVIRAAAADAGVALDSLDFFEAHGTGTALGDPIEIDGLTRAFESKRQNKAWIGSVKGNLGHLDSAAGAIGMAKAILALQHGVVPRQPHFEKPNPRIDFARAPVAVAQENQALALDQQPWRCGISAFGLSGINVHLILQQAQPLSLPADDGSWQCLLLSAASEQSLRAYAEALLQAVAAHPDWQLHAIAATLAAGREHLACRMAFTARTRDEFLGKLMAWCFGASTQALRSVRPDSAPVLLAGSLDEPQAREAAQAFMAGAEPLWPADRPAWRVHLPAAPLERVACWPKFSPQLPANRRAGWLGEGINSPQGWLFGVPVAAEDFWPVVEHRLADRPTLVGMGLIALLAEAMKQLAPQENALCIESLNWLRPLVADQVAGNSATLSLREEREGFSATLTARESDGGWADFSAARVHGLTGATGRIDLASLRAKINVLQPERALEQSGMVQVSARWDCRRKVWQSSDGSQTLAELALPNAYHSDLRATPWHPAMLDVAASLALDRPGFVPACCREVRLHRPLQARMLAHVTRQSAGQGLQADCVLLDEQGEVLAELLGLLFVPLQAGRANLHRLEWKEVALPAPVNAAAGEILLLGSGALADSLAQTLNEQGRAWRQRALPGDEAACQALAGEIASASVAQVVQVLPDAMPEPWPFAALMQAVCRSGLRSPLQWLALGRGALVGDADQSPDAALALGLLLSLSQEEPLLAARYIELDGAVPAQALLAELTAISSAALPLRLADGKRFQREISAPLPASADELPVGAGCVVFTGGLGAMALTLAEAVAPALGDSVALLHRGGFPVEAEWENLSHGNDEWAERAARLLALRAKGVALRLYPCDVTDRAALAQTLAQIRRDSGAIGGIVHTAGVAGGGFLINKDRAVFEAVLAPKVAATRHLHELTLSDAPRFFVLASSRTALSGAPGQTDYAAANAWLDAFAAWRQAQGLPATTIDWNTWSGIGMAVRMGAVDASRANLAPEQAGAVLLQALASGASQLVVAMPGENLAPRTTPAPVAAVSSADLPLDARVLGAVALGLGYETPLTLDDDFYSLGGDSITGMQIVNRLQRELGLPVSLADLFANSRLGDFVEAIRRVAQRKTPESGRPLAAPQQADYPVSREQLAVLQAEAVATPHTGYNLPQFLRLPADVDLPQLENAFNRLIERHEILRTRFSGLIHESPRMEILAAQPFLLMEQTLAALDAAAVQRLVRPFALTESPLFRASVLHVQHGYGEGALLFFDIHHAVADARCVNLLLADLHRLYRGETLAPLGLQQKDAAWYQQQQAQTQEAAARSYWLERFAGPLPKLDLPADHPRPRSHTNRGAIAGFAVPAEWVEPIRALAREQATTSYTLMLSLWSLLLGRLAGVDDLVIAVAADGRDREEFEATPGMFASLLPLRLKLAESERFAEVLQRNQRVHADAMRHRAFPLNRLLSTLRAPVTLDRTLLAEVMFSYMNFDHAGPAQEGFRLLPVANPACKADLAIFASDTGAQMSFAIEYYADLFDATRIERMGQDFLDLLRQLIEQGGDIPLAALRLSTAPLPACASLPIEAHEPQASQGGEVPAALLDMVLAVFRRFFNDAAIEPDDSFFDLGGHSLLGLQMANQLAQESGRELTIRDIFDHPTPLEMARLLASLSMGNHRIMHTEAVPGGRYPLSHAQQRLYVLHHTDGGAVAYNMSFVFRASGPLDLQRMQQALEKLCERHETLRTAFAEEDGQVWQVVQTGVRPEFHVHRLDADALDEVLSYFRQDAVLAFDLHRAPLLRMRICQLGGDQAFLSLVMHHIVGDGWSMQVFFGELMALYTDANVDLPPLQIQYRDYALWQQDRDWQAEAAYWKQTLQGAPERIALPGDAAISAKPMAAGVVRKMLPAALLEGLRQHARRKGVSLATLTLTLFSALLYRLTRQQDMVIGMGVAGRERAELEGLVGFFINILPIRVRMDDETEIDALLDQVHRASLEALERQDYPFDLLVREVVPARAQRESLINVMFEYQRYSDLKQIHGQTAQDGTLDFTLVDLDDFEGAPTQVDPGSPGVGPGAKYDLTLFVQDEPAGCRLKAEYDRSLLTEQTVTNWLVYLETFMTALIQSASRKNHENI